MAMHAPEQPCYNARLPKRQSRQEEFLLKFIGLLKRNSLTIAQRFNLNHNGALRNREERRLL